MVQGRKKDGGGGGITNANAADFCVTLIFHVSSFYLFNLMNLKICMWTLNNKFSPFYNLTCITSTSLTFIDLQCIQYQKSQSWSYWSYWCHTVLLFEMKPITILQKIMNCNFVKWSWIKMVSTFCHNFFLNTGIFIPLYLYACHLQVDHSDPQLHNVSIPWGYLGPKLQMCQTVVLLRICFYD